MYMLLSLYITFIYKYLLYIHDIYSYYYLVVKYELKDQRNTLNFL